MRRIPVSVITHRRVGPRRTSKHSGVTRSRCAPTSARNASTSPRFRLSGRRRGWSTALPRRIRGDHPCGAQHAALLWSQSRRTARSRLRVVLAHTGDDREPRTSTHRGVGSSSPEPGPSARPRRRDSVAAVAGACMPVDAVDRSATRSVSVALRSVRKRQKLSRSWAQAGTLPTAKPRVSRLVRKPLATAPIGADTVKTVSRAAADHGELHGCLVGASIHSARLSGLPSASIAGAITGVQLAKPEHNARRRAESWCGRAGSGRWTGGAEVDCPAGAAGAAQRSTTRRRALRCAQRHRAHASSPASHMT